MILICEKIHFKLLYPKNTNVKKKSVGNSSISTSISPVDDTGQYVTSLKSNRNCKNHHKSPASELLATLLSTSLSLILHRQTKYNYNTEGTTVAVFSFVWDAAAARWWGLCSISLKAAGGHGLLAGSSSLVQQPGWAVASAVLVQHCFTCYELAKPSYPEYHYVFAHL